MTEEDDGLDVPDFLLVRNRVPLSPEKAARLAEVQAMTRQPEEAWRRLDEVRKAERKRATAKRIEALLIAQGKRRVSAPPGTRWCVRTSRWVPDAG